MWPPQGLKLRLSAMNFSTEGCAGCMLLRDIAYSILDNEFKKREEDSKPFINGTVEFRIDQSHMVVHMWGQAPPYEVYSPHSMFKGDHQVMTNADGLVQENSWKIPQFPFELEVSSYSGSSHAIKRTQLWLRECEETHEYCSRILSHLPSRVILIQGPQDIKLYESNGEMEPYVCLSHCWGKKHIIRTITSNLQKHNQRIIWTRLPLTFRHAVSFTYRLGIKYLWIDSLCIIQDDINDWRHEGSKMADIYSGAYITLAATASRDASGGCFRRSAERSVFRLSYPDENGSKSDLFIRSSIGNANFFRSRAPLSGRGWTLQERMLSPRNIHFTRNELVWECKTKSTCECDLHEHSFDRYHSCGPSLISHKLRSTDNKYEDWSDAWRTIVQQYSDQRLTYEKDIFPALQGISNVFYKYTRSHYLAGLWEDGLVVHLLWRSSMTNSRPQKWRAPSWSWASVVGPITWDSESRHESYNFSPQATCINKEIQVAGADDFGELLSGSITLRARCFTQDLQQSIFSTGGIPVYRRRFRPKHPVWRGLDPYIDVFLDCDVEEFEERGPHSTPLRPEMCIKTVVMMKHKRNWDGDGDGDGDVFYRIKYSCLLLCKDNDNGDAYQRFGFLRVNMRVFPETGGFEFPLEDEEILRIV
jgi:hypothetical protein